LNIAFSSVLMARLILFRIDIQVFFVIPAKSWNPLDFDIHSIPDALCCVRNDEYWKVLCQKTFNTEYNLFC
jgi:hypothetical protein